MGDSWPAVILTVFIVLNLSLVGLLRIRPRITTAAGGRAFAFLALFVLPVLIFAFSTTHHMEKATTTEFCLSCHVMEPYGASLRVDSPDHLPATHFQQHRVPPDRACYTCHTSYAMFGDARAKLNGIRHVVVNYVGTIPDELTLYQPYRNRECLHCHAGARGFEEQPFHMDLRGDLDADVTSCLDCHAVSHDIEAVETLPQWRPPTAVDSGERP